MSVAQLKDELRKKNASLTGKKADLIARLEAYDRNFGLSDLCTGADIQENTIITPADSLYRDVNASTKLPSFTRHHMQAFAERYNKSFGNAQQMYASRHLFTVRAVESGEFTFFKAQCKASMKKLMYGVDVKLHSNSGTIEETHCECAAGSGVEAHCKHVLVVMFGIDDMVRHKTLLTHQVCTQQLMTFKQPKPFYASPIQCHKMPSKRQRAICYDPVSEGKIPESYNDYVRNLIINFGSTTVPLKQTYAPANTYAVEWDHSFYCVLSGEDIILQKLLLKNVSSEKIAEIEESTRLQEQSETWINLRKSHITASNFHSVCHCKDINKKHMVTKIMSPKHFHSKATMHGKTQEPFAIKQFEEMFCISVIRCGIFLSETHPFLGASPDGLVGANGILEVKCPYSAKYREVNPQNVPFLEYVNGELTLKTKHPYYSQIQGQLFCTQRQYSVEGVSWCTFNFGCNRDKKER